MQTSKSLSSFMLWIPTKRVLIHMMLLAMVNARKGSSTVNVCEGRRLTIQCPSGGGINITEANYGRLDNTTCSEGLEHKVSNKDCRHGRSFQTVADACNDKNACTMVISNYMFGGDPCQGTSKYGIISYDCLLNLPMCDNYGDEFILHENVSIGPDETKDMEGFYNTRNLQRNCYTLCLAKSMVRLIIYVSENNCYCIKKAPGMQGVVRLETDGRSGAQLAVRKCKRVGLQNRKCESPWLPYHDPYKNQDYCYLRHSEGSQKRTYSDARKDCLNYGAKIVTPRGKNMHTSAWVSPKDGTLRWVDVTYDHALDMYVQNGGVPLDTNWLTWTPWDTAGGHPSYGRGELGCTATNNELWKSVHCDDIYNYVCEFQICPDGWVYNPYVDRCNKFFDSLDDFELATKRCSESEAIIETPRSREAEQFLKNLTHHPRSTILWIGMMNLEETTWFDNTTWRWNDGAKVTWTAWDGHTNLHVSNRRFKNSKQSEFKCMSTNVAGGIIDKEHIWSRSGCNTTRVQAKYVCGKIRCRYPYSTLLNEDTFQTFPTCYRAITTPVNARQAGQFCAEDGSESNPSRLASPNNSLKLRMLNKVASSNIRIWTGFVFNRAHWKWQTNENTFVEDRFELEWLFNYYCHPWTTDIQYLRLGRSVRYAKGYGRYGRYVKGYGRHGRYAKGYGTQYTEGYGPHGRLLPCNLNVWAGEGRVCTVRAGHKRYMTPYACNAVFGFVCEREQPYVLTTCAEQIQNAKRVHYVTDNSPYYPSVPQTQKMTCYYYNTEVSYMNYAEADRYCSGLGGYIIMPKSKRQLVQAVGHLSRSQPPRVWIGADQIGHCFNKNSMCTPNSNNFKYLDGSDIFGSDLGLPRWDPGTPDNFHSAEDCVYFTIGSWQLNDDRCTNKRKVVCQVSHNNLKAQRNWHFLTACNSDYAQGVPNWYAAPGDKCFHTIMTKQPQLLQNDFWKACIALAGNSVATPAKPAGKDQTRSLLLSRSMNINSISPSILQVTKSYIGIDTFHAAKQGVFFKNFESDDSCSGQGDDDSRIWAGEPFNGSCIPIRLLNFIPGTVHGPQTPGNCIQMTANGRWQKIPCRWSRYFSCEKQSNPSLATKRAALVRAGLSGKASGADVPCFESRWASLVITSSFLFWV